MSNLTTGQVAEKLLVSKSAVMRLVKAGELPAVKGESGDWLFDEQEVESYMQTIRPPYAMDGDPAAVATVRRIFAEFTALYHPANLDKIADGLNTDQVATAKGASQWFASGVKNILAQDAYADLVGQKTFQTAQERLSRLRSGPTAG